MNDFVELSRLVGVILRRWWLLVAFIAIGASIAYVMSQSQTPVYQATTTILVGQSIKSPQLVRTDLQTSDALVQTYVEMTHRQPVLEGVIAALQLNTSWDKLNKQVTASQVLGTQLIEIKVEAGSSRTAKKIADEVAHQMVLISPSTNLQDKEKYPFYNFNRDELKNMQERIVNGQTRLGEIETALKNPVSEARLAELQNEKSTLTLLLTEWEKNYEGLLTLIRQEKDLNEISVVETAHANNTPIRPRVPLNTILGGGIGMLLGLSLIILLDFLDDTYKSLKDFSQSTDLNILGSVGKINGKKYSSKIIAHEKPDSPITEAYRLIRSRIQFRSADHPIRSIMVTSSMPDEDKSVTAANLAVVFAQANLKTIIVDADLRNPALHQIFDVEKAAGLGDMLASPELKLEDCLKNTFDDNLQILTSGKRLPDPSERLGSQRMAEILAELNQVADIVIFDSSPAAVFADAVVLSRQVDGVIVTIRARKSKRDAVKQTLLDLQNVKAKVLGVIFSSSAMSNTSSRRRAYLQERSRFASTKESSKKVRAAANQSLDLSNSAMPSDKNEVLSLETVDVDSAQSPDLANVTPANGKTELTSLGQVDVDTIPSPDLGEAAMPTDENNESTCLVDQVDVDPTQSGAADDSAMPADENIELTGLGQADVDTIPSPALTEAAMPADENTESTSLVDQVDVDSTPSPDLPDSAMLSEENLELALLDTDVEEAKINDLQDSKGSHRANHKRRPRH